MHMDTVGLSRGAPDCSETNFTIISFGGDVSDRVYLPDFRKWQVSKKLYRSCKDEKV